MFSQRLVETIRKRGLSRYKIAQDTKITEATLSNYSNGKVNPSPSIVKQLADYLGVDYNWLLTGEGNGEILTGSNILADSTSTYRARKKKYSKNDLNSIIDYFESQLKTKDTIIKNHMEDLSVRMTSIENKLDLLFQVSKLGKK
ncbi:MAG: helix-turn-helix domain-containing protein [Dysgonamonadaceae bacterium]|jgi:transcriptional regulator with XRE-family HTH domain|nr:helix-turn-helix domain-containing protein [Dysgonamonadaceae bacterium]